MRILEEEIRKSIFEDEIVKVALADKEKKDKNRTVQHKNLYKDWKEHPIAYQMGNIGSEVSRSLKNKDNPRRFGCFNRALELFDFTIDALQEKREFGKLKEVCRAREEFCDYFNVNSFNTNPQKMQRYYDQFVSLIR